MRHVIPWLGVGGLLLVAGCTNTRLGFLKGPENPPPNTARPTPTAAALVAYLNNNAQLVRSLRCDKMEMTAARGLGIIQKFDLNGSIACEQPRNFRMAAQVAGNDELDIGSNNQEFWFWIKKLAPQQYYCPYEAMSGRLRIQLPFPFQPEWVMETLGMANYGSGADWQLTVDASDPPRWYKLTQHTKSPQGNPVRKVIVFNAREQRGSSPQVTDYLLIDEATNKEVCSAHIVEVQGEVGKGVVPSRVELNWPQEGARLTLRLGRASINPTLPGPLFVRRPLNGQPSINMATARPDGQPSGLTQVRGR
jgi:hypothetical protein